MKQYPTPPRRPQARRDSASRRGAVLRCLCRGLCVATVLLAVALAVTTVRASSSDRSRPSRPSIAAVDSPALDSPLALLTEAPIAQNVPRSSAAPAGQDAPRSLTPPVAQSAPRWDAAPVTPSRWLSVTLTAYSASEEEGTAWGITYTGVRAWPGTVAVDPSVIPLGSRLRIDGLPGTYRAEDTGGGIVGAHIDVFMESRALALAFGRLDNVRAEILVP